MTSTETRSAREALLCSLDPACSILTTWHGSPHFLPCEPGSGTKPASEDLGREIHQACRKLPGLVRASTHGHDSTLATQLVPYIPGPLPWPLALACLSTPPALITLWLPALLPPSAWRVLPPICRLASSHALSPALTWPPLVYQAPYCFHCSDSSDVSLTKL